MPEILDKIWIFMHKRGLVPVFLILAFLVQIRTGYFRHFFPWLKTLKPKKSLLAAVFFIAGVFLMLVFTMDVHAVEFAKTVTSGFGGLIVDYGSEMGKSIWIFLFLAYLACLKAPKARDLVFGATLATCLNGLSTTLLKSLILRARPGTGEGAFSFFNWGAAGDTGAYQSTPSGDVSIIAGACFFLMLSLRKNPAALLFLVTPMATAFARMHYERHWLSDTWAAMALGLEWSLLVWSYQRFRLNAG